jgi:hypothetical protein
MQLLQLIHCYVVRLEQVLRALKEGVCDHPGDGLSNLVREGGK